MCELPFPPLSPTPCARWAVVRCPSGTGVVSFRPGSRQGTLAKGGGARAACLQQPRRVRVSGVCSRDNAQVPFRHTRGARRRILWAPCRRRRSRRRPSRRPPCRRWSRRWPCTRRRGGARQRPRRACVQEAAARAWAVRARGLSLATSPTPPHPTPVSDRDGERQVASRVARVALEAGGGRLHLLWSRVHVSGTCAYLTRRSPLALLPPAATT